MKSSSKLYCRGSFVFQQSDAQDEELRMQQVHEEKQQRLRQFQEDVKHRVQKLEKLKREQQLADSYKAVSECSVVVIIYASII